MTNNPTIDGVSLLPCPFCGKAPVPEVSKPRSDGCAWTYVWCRSCPVKPYSHGSADTFCSDGFGRRIRFRTDEEASQAATERAVSRWNNRSVQPEVTALQSTIAQLQARVQELESGRDDSVAWVEVGNSQFGPYTFYAKEIMPEGRHLLYTAPPAPVAESEDFPACDYCGTVPDYHPWHGAGLINGKESPHIHACTECRHKLPAAVAVVLPSRKSGFTTDEQHAYLRGWNACLDATAALNEGGNDDLSRFYRLSWDRHSH